MKMRLIGTLCAVFLLVAFYGACSGGGDSRWGDPVLDGLLDYGEYELTTFNIVGTIRCQKCIDRNADVIAVKIEVLPQDDPTKELAVKMFDGVGPFTISNIRYKTGAKLTLYVRLYTGIDNVGYSKDVEATVPEEDGDTVAVTINFD